MKTYIKIALLGLLSCVAIVDAAYDRSDLLDSLESAIEKSDAVSAKKALKRLSPLSVKNQKALLDLAEEILEEREENATLLKSGRDLTNLAAGVAVVLTSGFMLVRSFAPAGNGSSSPSSSQGHSRGRRMVDYDDEYQGAPGSNWLYSLPWVAGVFGGLYCAQQGAFCTQAKARLKAAEEIVDALKKVEIEKA